jgi:hypothetical protein
VLCGLALAPGASTLAASFAPTPEAVPSRELPFPSRDERVASLWARAIELEIERSFAAAAGLYEQIVALDPGEAHVYWRIARNHMLAGQLLPMADEQGRLREFTLTEEWGRRGAETDPGCAECYLYEFIGLASAARIHGIWNSARNAGRMMRLLERAETLGPTHVDHPWNDERANLYFAKGVFYNVVPDSRVAQWTLGVRGSKQKSRLAYRKAIEICPRRVDYHMGLAPLLVCAGQQADDPELYAEGVSLLERIATLEDFLGTDPIDRDHAAILLAEPERACDYSRDRWRLEEGR